MKSEGNREVRVIDLHLKAGYNSSDALDRQLARFRAELQSAMRAGEREIIFIHGSGSGKLKEELSRILATDYPSFSYYDAAFSRYGYGAAICVVINRR